MNIDAPGLETYVVKGLEDQIAKYFGVNKTFFVSSTDRLSRMKVLSQNKDLKYPVAFLTFTTGSEGQTYNPRSVRRHGVLTDMNAEQTHMGKVYAVPTLMTFNLVLLTDEFAHVLKFFKLWMLATTASSLSFDITYDNAPFSIGVKPTSSLSIPSKDTTAEAASFFEFEGTLDVNGFVSPDQIEQTPLVSKVSVVTHT